MNFTSIREAATRPDFPELMSTGLKTALMDAYNNTPSEYEKVVSFETSTKAKESYIGSSDLELPEVVLEGEPYPEKSNFAVQGIEVTNYKVGEIIAITRELVDDDETKKVKDMPNNLGRVHKKQENRCVFSMLVKGTTAATCYDGLAIFTTNHLNRKGGAAQADNDNIYTNVTLTAGAIIVAMSMINLWKGLYDEPIEVSAQKLLCPVRLQYTAQYLMSNAALPPYAANALGPAASTATVGFSPLGSIMEVVASKWLEKVGGGTGDWYILTDVPGFIFQWRDKLELYAEGDVSKSWFERDVMRWKSRARYGYKVVDWRFGMLVS